MKRVRTRRSSQVDEASPRAIAVLFALLALSWVLWSGVYKPLVLTLGVLSCLLTVYLAKRMGFFRHRALLVVIPKLPRYWRWLLREIVVSSFNVARLILKPSLSISPTLVEIEADTGNEVAKVILANSITLSPGTVTLDVHDGRLLVHCLTHETARGLQEGDVKSRVAQLGLG